MEAIESYKLEIYRHLLSKAGFDIKQKCLWELIFPPSTKRTEKLQVTMIKLFNKQTDYRETEFFTANLHQNHGALSFTLLNFIKCKITIS